MKQTLLYLAFLLFSVTITAQPFVIRGTVIDAETKEPLPGVAVTAIAKLDSNNAQSTLTNGDGVFVLASLQNRGIYVQLSSLGYASKTISLRLEQRVTSLDTIALSTAAQLLTEVEVTGVQQRAVMKGDTTQFNADTYKTNPDATAEDLIKKIPGVEVSNGQVKAQGEQVRRVMVDGRPFFGEDPQAALKNLPAQAIEKIEIFDRRTDQAQFTGFDDGEEEKTINIITRPSFRNGTFGRAFAGYGSADRYEAGGNVNNFKDASRLSIIGMSNNINQQNFGNEDLLGVVGTSQNAGGGGRWRRGPSVDSDPNDFAVGNQSGINTTHSFGVNYSNQWGEKFKLNTSYFLNRTVNENQQFINQINFVTDTSNQIYSSAATGSGANLNHRFNLRMEYKPSAKNQFIFTPSASLQQNNSSFINQAITTTEANNPINTSDNIFTNDLSGYNIGSNLLWMHRFGKEGRTLSFNVKGNASANEGSTNLFANNTFYRATIETDTLAQEGLPLSKSLNMSTRTRYTEPLSARSQLQLSYDYDLNYDDANRETYNIDPDSGLRVSLDSNVSNVFTSVYQEHEFGLTYRFNTKKLNLGTGAEYQYATLTSDLQFPRTGEINRVFQNIQPYAFLRYSISRQKNLRMYYRASTDAPSVTQLQDVVNNSNPLQLTVGNPALNQSFGNRLVVRYGSSNLEKGTNFNAYLYARQINNYITNATLVTQRDTTLADGVILPQGAQLSYPVNLDGFYNLRGEATWGLPVAALLSNLDISTGLNFSRTPGLINNQDNISQTYGISQRLNLASNFSDKIDFNVGISANINLVYNSLQPERNNNFYVQTISAGLTYIFWRGVVFRTNFTHQWYTGLDEAFNQNFALLNASLGKKLFKNQQGEISLRVFDILNQNRSIARNVTESFVQDVQTLVLEQYIMFTFTYNIRAFKAE